MFWKIVLAVVLVWVALAVVGALIKGLFWVSGGRRCRLRNLLPGEGDVGK